MLNLVESMGVCLLEACTHLEMSRPTTTLVSERGKWWGVGGELGGRQTKMLYI